MALLTIFLSFLVGALAIYYTFFRKLGRLQKLGILHVKPYPIFGNMAGPLFRRCTFIETIDRVYKLRDDAKYVGFYDFAEPVIMIKSSELIKDITVKHFDHFVDHRGFADAEQDPLFGNNLFALRGEKWKHMRNMLSPAFTSSKMKSMFKLMSNVGESFADYVVQKSIDEPASFEVKDAFTRYTNDVIATCAFGISIDSMRNPNNEFYVLGRRSTDLEGILSLKFFLIRSFPRIAKFFKITIVEKRVEKFFENVIRETVETRDREGIFRPDLIQLMMESRDNKSEGQPDMTISDMTSQAFIFFFGGFDTTSTLMCFAAYALAIDTAVQKKLQDEIEQVLEETGGHLTYDAINKMEYLDAVINESLRLYPIGGFLDRLCVKPYELPPAFPGADPVKLEPGNNLWFPVYSLHRDPKYFSDPEIFDPERFLGSRKNDVDPFAYIPFGQGPRMCIGNRFGLLETKVLFFHLLAKCHIRPSPKMIVPLEMSRASFTPAAKGGFWLEFEARDNFKTTDRPATGSDL